MSGAVPGDGPFSDFGFDADIMGFSVGTLACIAIIGILSLLIGQFFRKSVLPRILGKMFGQEMKSGDMLGTRGSRAVGLAAPQLHDTTRRNCKVPVRIWVMLTSLQASK